MYSFQKNKQIFSKKEDFSGEQTGFLNKKQHFRKKTVFTNGRTF
jgi:hypothetical protein